MWDKSQHSDTHAFVLNRPRKGGHRSWSDTADFGVMPTARNVEQRLARPSGKHVGMVGLGEDRGDDRDVRDVRASVVPRSHRSHSESWTSHDKMIKCHAARLETFSARHLTFSVRYLTFSTPHLTFLSAT